MSKLSAMSKMIAFVCALAVVTLAGNSSAQARWYGHHGWHHGPYGDAWYGNGWRGYTAPLGPGWGWPYYYAPSFESGPRDCSYVRVRVWYHGHWRVRRAWRCW